MKTSGAAAIDRRHFFKLLGGGLFVAYLAEPMPAQERRGRRGGPPRPMEVSAWIHIGENGAVKVFTGKTEVGQNIRTSLSQAVAEELQVPIASIQMVMADTDLVPFDMGTFGSRTTPDMALHLRKVAAAAREELVRLALQRFPTGEENLVVQEGKVILPKDHTNGGPQTLTFVELLEGKQITVTVTDQTKLKPAAEWKVAGTSVAKVDGKNFVTGRHRFTTDIQMPGMVHGKVLRAPAYGATLKSLDDSQAKALEGVTVVRDGDFVGVTAPNPGVALQAVGLLKADWEGAGDLLTRNCGRS